MLPANVVEQSINVFRDNLFDMTQRKNIPHKIYEILEAELIEEQKSDLYNEIGEKGGDVAKQSNGERRL